MVPHKQEVHVIVTDCTRSIIIISDRTQRCPASEQGLPLTEEEQAQQNTTTSLTVPGRVIHLSALLNKRKFRNKKEAAVAGLQLLEKVGLGKLESMNPNPKRGAALVNVSIKLPWSNVIR